MSVPVTILLVCQYGEPVRGVSPYGDSLCKALSKVCDLRVQPIDYRAPYPEFLHPAVQVSENISGDLHWGNPLSWQRLARQNADIVHLQHWSGSMGCYLVMLVAMVKRSGKRVVITVHNPDSHEALSWFVPFERCLLTQADALVVHDARGAAALQKRFSFFSGKIHVIPHGIGVNVAPPLPDAADYFRIKLDPNRRYVCIFGNLRGYKGVEILLASWEHIADLIPDVDLVIAGRFWSGQGGLWSRYTAKMLGTSQEEAQIKAALVSPKLAGRVHLLEGFQSDADIDSLLKLSEFAVFPYIRFASQSGAACRAAGMGCPVLVSDVGGLPELAINQSWIIAPEDPAKLALALYDKLTIQNNEANRTAQLERVKSFDWPLVAVAHAALYRRLV